MRDLQCDPATLAGPVDRRVVERLNNRHPLDADYLACIENCHGGVPKVCSLQTAGIRCSIARFLTLVDDESELSEPFQPHFEDSGMDDRVVNSISYLRDYEHATSRALFGLIPFASTRDGKKWCLDRASVDLFCFDYRVRHVPPRIALWHADAANEARLEWELLPPEEQFDGDDNYLSVPWNRFVVPLADSFAAFLHKLEPAA